MNIAVCLIGVTHDGAEPIYSNPYGRIRQRDWKLAAPFVKSQIIDCWEGHNVKTYITTYDHPELMEMLAFYKPEKCTLAPDSESNMILTFLKGLEALRGTDTDFIVAVRPDIKFFKKLNTFNIQFDKFNFYCKEVSGMWDEFGTLSIDTTGEITGTVGASVGWDPHGKRGHSQFNFVVDSLFMCPMSMLEQFIDAVYNSYYDSENRFSEEGVAPGFTFSTLHGLWNYVSPKVGRENIHFLLSERYYSGNAPIADFHREIKQFSTPPWNYNSFLLREPDHKLEPWNHNSDWIAFAKEPIKE